MERRQEHSGASSTTGTTGSSIAGLRQYYVAVGSMKVKLVRCVFSYMHQSLETPLDVILISGQKAHF